MGNVVSGAIVVRVEAHNGHDNSNKCEKSQCGRYL
jgi:hypothetical protein